MNKALFMCLAIEIKFSLTFRTRIIKKNLQTVIAMTNKKKIIILSLEVKY